MRIGLIAPPRLPVPPPGYGGTEVVVDNLARGLARRGHDIRLVTVGAGVPEAAHLLAAYGELSDVDIVHDHTVPGPLVAARHGLAGTPVVVTNHGPFTPDTSRIFAEVARHAAIVAVSCDQARSAGAIPVRAVIHYGIDIEAYRPGPGGGGYMLFVGRMCADKGAHRAVRTAHRAGRRLVIATRIREPGEQSYFAERVQPLLGADDEVMGEVPLSRRMELLRHADALLNPTVCPEPFGLVMAEALACGTPVLAFPRGAAPEIIEHGRTGYLCGDEAEMASLLDVVGQIDREYCRASAEQRFSMARMAADYERLYREILAVGGRLPRQSDVEEKR